MKADSGTYYELIEQLAKEGDLGKGLVTHSHAVILGVRSAARQSAVAIQQPSFSWPTNQPTN